jgi:hypothetical protein
VAVGLALVALVLIVLGPSRAVRAETGMDDDAEARVLLRYYPEGTTEEASEPTSEEAPGNFDTAQIRALRDLDDETPSD